MHKPKVRYQQRPKTNKPVKRSSTQVRKQAGIGKPFKSSNMVKRSMR